MPRLLLITHEHIGANMLQTAEAIIGKTLELVACVEAPMDADTDDIINSTRHLIDGHDTLILTDLYGSTPGNIAMQLAASPHCHAVSGLNLPMLLRAINYQNRPLDELASKAAEGGKNGILHD